MRSILRSIPFQLLICIIFATLFSNNIPLEITRFFYSFSLFFIDTILLFLPIIIFSYIFNALKNIEKNTTILIIVLLAIICVSNFLAITYSYNIGRLILPYLNIEIEKTEINSIVTPFFKLNIKNNLRTDIIVLIAFLFSNLCAKFKNSHIFFKKVTFKIESLQKLINIFLNKIFLPILPIYIFGFMLKISVDGNLKLLYEQYLGIFAINIALSFCYVFIFYLIACFLNKKNLKQVIVNMLPAGITGFSTMSGTVAMPVTIACSEKNVNNTNLSRLTISTSSNMHMLGDDISITLMAMALLLINGQSIPDFLAFIPFIIGFCIAKLACVGVAGASLLVILPVLKEKLGFSSEMISIITTIYILHDSFGTFHNVMGNGAFAMILDKIFQKLKF